VFDGITEQRVLAMTKQEKRWLDNIKKAFHESDLALQSGRPEDRCLPELLKAVDTAKTLRRALRGDDPPGKGKGQHDQNKKRFIEFLGLEIPMARDGHFLCKLPDAKTGRLREHTFGEIVYLVRCMVLHENENLNAAENVDYCILLDWSVRNPMYLGEWEDGKFVCNGYFLWNRLRQVLSKFITGLEGMANYAQGKPFSIGINPALGTIRPARRLRRSGS
jgi:hypothetical protein